MTMSRNDITKAFYLPALELHINLIDEYMGVNPDLTEDQRNLLIDLKQRSLTDSYSYFSDQVGEVVPEKYQKLLTKQTKLRQP